MSCASIDLKAYFLGETSAGESRAASDHLASCAACREEYERLRLTQAALLTLREEEIPRRIAFVSDKVFEPRWYQRLWRSGPRLGFASAAMLSCAILVHAFYQPAPVTSPVAAVDVEAKMQTEVARLLDSAVRAAVAQAAALQEKRTAELLAATEKRMKEENQEMMLAASETIRVMNERLNSYYKQMQLASVDTAGVQ
jgi:anti-sigma factor RsiW